jgi:Holliday junction resolvase
MCGIQVKMMIEPLLVSSHDPQRIRTSATSSFRQRERPHPVVKYLRELGHDVLTVQEAGKANQRIPDEEVLAFATENDRAIITQNRKDFIQLHRNRIKDLETFSSGGQ